MPGNKSANKCNVRSTILLMALAASGIHQSALANSVANASAFNFRYVLSDMNPDDGIAPSLTWIPSPEYGNASVVGYYWSSVVFSGTPQGDAPLTREWIDGGDAVSAGIEGATQLGTTAITASATSAGSPFIAFWTEAAVRSKLGAFVLSPGSAVSFSVDYTLSGLITDSIVEYSWADAEALLSGSLYGVGGVEGGLGQDYGATSAHNFDTDGHARSGTLTFTLSNAANIYSEGTVRFDAYAKALSVTVPEVPEPSTYAMLLAGLALSPLLRKRRQSPR